MRLVICGFHFDSKHKAILVIYVQDKGSFSIHALAVDRHGQFQAEWPLGTCSNMPTLIEGNENGGAKQIKVKLPITSFGSCSAPTTITAGKPFGF
jgi:hypothetical protein